jgi:hypothetical protein
MLGTPELWASLSSADELRDVAGGLSFWRSRVDMGVHDDYGQTPAEHISVCSGRLTELFWSTALIRSQPL